MIPKTIKEVRQILKDEGIKRDLERSKDIEVIYQEEKQTKK